jgi:hypothetical protein
LHLLPLGSSELGFFDNYIIPLAKKLKDCNVFGAFSDDYLNYAVMNRAEWEEKGESIVAGYVEYVASLEQEEKDREAETLHKELDAHHDDGSDADADCDQKKSGDIDDTGHGQRSTASTLIIGSDIDISSSCPSPKRASNKNNESVPESNGFDGQRPMTRRRFSIR